MALFCFVLLNTDTQKLNTLLKTCPNRRVQEKRELATSKLLCCGSCVFCNTILSCPVIVGARLSIILNEIVVLSIMASELVLHLIFANQSLTVHLILPFALFVFHCGCLHVSAMRVTPSAVLFE